MAKVDLTTISGGYNLSAINANFTAIANELENLMSRVNDTDADNFMEENLDMNSQRIYNLPAPDSSTEPVRLADLEEAALGDYEFVSLDTMDGFEDQLTGFNVYPSNPNYSASTDGDYTEAPTDTTALRDADNNVIYITSETVSGTITALDFDTLSATVGGTDVSLWKYTSDTTEIRLSQLDIADGEDEITKFKWFMALPLDKVLDVNISVSGMANMADNTTLRGIPSATITVTGDVSTDSDAASANQGQVIELGDNCVIDGVQINGGGNKGAGILNNQKDNCTVKFCTIYNGTGQGINDNVGTNSVYIGNTIYSCQHGIQMWLSSKVRISDNYIYQVTGGIWTAAADNVIATGNLVTDCSDVGIDWEGGYDCYSIGNTVKSCANGALAIFNNGTSSTKDMGRLVHKDNLVVHTATYLDIDGVETDNGLSDTAALMLYTVDDDTVGPITFSGNEVHVVDTTATVPNSLRAIACRACSETISHFVEFVNNRVYTNYSSALRLQELYKLKFSGNEIHFMSESPTNYDEFKNHHYGYIQDNMIYFEDGVTPNDETWYIYTDESMDGDLCISGNQFFEGGTTALAIDQYVSRRVVKVGRNRLTEPDGTTTGGLTVANGYLEYDHQDLVFSIDDNEVFELTDKTCLTEGRFSTIGHVSMTMGGTNGPLYRVAVQGRRTSGTLKMEELDTGGAVSTGIFPNAARYVTFGDTSITPTDTDGATSNSAIFKITVSERG